MLCFKNAIIHTYSRYIFIIFSVVLARLRIGASRANNYHNLFLLQFAFATGDDFGGSGSGLCVTRSDVRWESSGLTRHLIGCWLCFPFVPFVCDSRLLSSSGCTLYNFSHKIVQRNNRKSPSTLSSGVCSTNPLLCIVCRIPPEKCHLYCVEKVRQGRAPDLSQISLDTNFCNVIFRLERVSSLCRFCGAQRWDRQRAFAKMRSEIKPKVNHPVTGTLTQKKWRKNVINFIRRWGH